VRRPQSEELVTMFVVTAGAPQILTVANRGSP
jgi:hypothetical protein